MQMSSGASVSCTTTKKTITPTSNRMQIYCAGIYIASSLLKHLCGTRWTSAWGTERLQSWEQFHIVWWAFTLSSVKKVLKESRRWAQQTRSYQKHQEIKKWSGRLCRPGSARLTQSCKVQTEAFAYRATLLHWNKVGICISTQYIANSWRWRSVPSGVWRDAFNYMKSKQLDLVDVWLVCDWGWDDVYVNL